MKAMVRVRASARIMGGSEGGVHHILRSLECVQAYSIPSSILQTSANVGKRVGELVDAQINN